MSIGRTLWRWARLGFFVGLGGAGALVAACSRSAGIDAGSAADAGAPADLAVPADAAVPGDAAAPADAAGGAKSDLATWDMPLE